MPMVSLGRRGQLTSAYGTFEGVTLEGVTPQEVTMEGGHLK